MLVKSIISHSIAVCGNICDITKNNIVAKIFQRISFPLLASPIYFLADPIRLVSYLIVSR